MFLFLQIVVPDADTPGFRLRAQVVGEDQPRVLLLERGDAATVGEVKAALGQQDAGLDPAQLIVFAGGRMLQDTMTLRKCRIKVSQSLNKICNPPSPTAMKGVPPKDPRPATRARESARETGGGCPSGPKNVDWRCILDRRSGLQVRLVPWLF